MPSKRKRQTRLAFEPLPSSSPASQPYPKQIRDRAAAVTLQGFSSPKRRKLDEDSAPALPTPSATLEVADDSDSEPIRVTQRATARRPETASEVAPTLIAARSVRAAQTRGRSGIFHTPLDARSSRDAGQDSDSSAGSSEAEESTMQPSRRRRRPREKSSPPLPQTNSDDDRDGEDMPTSAGTKRRQRRAASRSSFVSSSPPRAVVSDDDVIIVKSTTTNPQEIDSDDSAPKTPRRRRLAKRPRKISQEEKAELTEDLDFIGPGSDSEAEPRTTQSVKKNARQAALERLKQRRRGPTAGGEVTQAEAADMQEAEGPSDDDDAAEPLPSSRQMFERDQDDDDFIVEGGEDDSLGVPEGMPIAYTSFASQKPRNLFIFAVDWFVQKKINPAFRAESEIYDLTFKKLDDEIRGLAGSKFTSAAWTQDFTLALNARPEIIVEPSASGLSILNKCDACNRTGHPATYTIQFQGRPYHQDTLEDVGDDNDEEDDDEDDDEDEEEDEASANGEDRRNRDAQGRPIVPESTTFCVGKFCTANARTAHALRHWRYHLNEWIATWLISRGYWSAEAVLRRDRLSAKKRRKEVKKIVNLMQDEGVVKQLWREFRNTADIARNAKQGRFDAGSP